MNLIFPSLEVKMECYEGPLAVLVTLIKKNKVSIWDIPLSTITERFLQYVDLVTEMNLKIAEDFIEIASLLIYIKSRMLLPTNGDGQQEDDPREELIDRILEYERLRAMVDSIDGLPMLHRDIFARGKTVAEAETDFNLLALCNIFLEIMKSKEEKYLEIREIRPTLEEKLNMLKTILETSGVYIWNFNEMTEQPEKIATVLGILELTKIKMATITQRRPFGKIIIKRRNDLSLPSQSVTDNSIVAE
ncbi:MAG: ScpA family protein [Syntrophorhabdus sp.]